MKINNPLSREHLNIKKTDRVLEVGGGHNPHRRSNVVVDKFIDSNYHRKTDIRVYRHQEFMQADGENLPFENRTFDYVMSNQVLEHVPDPARFLEEQMRVAPKGYIETPSLIGEYLFPKESHKWLILELDNKLVLFDKEKYGFKTNLDPGFLFLTWLPKTSVAWKMLMQTHADLMTVRYQWKDEIEFEVNPDNPEYLKFFNAQWNEQMAKVFFPDKGKVKAFVDATKSLVSIGFKGLLRA